MITSIPEEERQRLTLKAIAWIFDKGLNKSQVKEKIRSSASVDLPEEDIDCLMDAAFKEFTEAQKEATSSPEIIKEHVGYYEGMYQYFKGIGHSSGKNKMMQAKEKLLNIVKENYNKITLRKSEVTIRKSAKKEYVYDYSRLTENEIARLKFLYGKTQA